MIPKIPDPSDNIKREGRLIPNLHQTVIRWRHNPDTGKKEKVVDSVLNFFDESVRDKKIIATGTAFRSPC